MPTVPSRATSEYFPAALALHMSTMAPARAVQEAPHMRASLKVILSGTPGLIEPPEPRTEAVRAAPLVPWPAGTSAECAHAGLFVLFGAMVELGVDQVIAAGAYPSTSSLSAWHWMGSLLVLKLLRAGRVSHATEVAADSALGLAVGLNVLPKATHATTYSYRVRREMNTAALSCLVARLRQIGLASGDASFNPDFHSMAHAAPAGRSVLAGVAALPDSAWRSVRIDRAGHYRHPQLYESTVAIKGIARPSQIAVRTPATPRGC
ncbi:MAG: hypothetical protein ACRD1K_01375 [Acidimicrobiales bacterium]